MLHNKNIEERWMGEGEKILVPLIPVISFFSSCLWLLLKFIIFLHSVKKNHPKWNYYFFLNILSARPFFLGAIFYYPLPSIFAFSFFFFPHLFPFILLKSLAIFFLLLVPLSSCLGPKNYVNAGDPQRSKVYVTVLESPCSIKAFVAAFLSPH